jgi:osmotically-inducible protein OsmY
MTFRTSALSLSLALAIVPVAACSHDAPQRSDSTVATTSGSSTMPRRDDDHDGTVTTRDTDHDGTRDTVAVRGEGHTTVATRDTDHDGTDDTVDAHGASTHASAGHGASQPTAMDQSEDAHDVDITGRIRQAVVADSSLSLGARNCVIVTQHGHVTLRGDVTRAERDAIVVHAERVAGVTNVNSELHVTDMHASH